ncbi:MAG: hypothetical protein SFV54_19295 [Bryobacteraceae bacterium]|nr:hypothetical protein [Bryobacteraceae bacterium]
MPLFTRRTQIALAVLLAAVAAGAWFWIRRPHSTAPAALLPYIPPADAALVYLDVAALRQAGILQRLNAAPAAQDPDYRSFVDATKFDYTRDLDAALLSFQDTGNFMVLRGRFDWNALRRYVQANQGSCDNGPCRIQGSQPGRRISFYEIRPDLMALAVSQDAYAAALITRHPSTPPLHFPNSPIWFTIPPKDLRRDSLPTGTRTFASALEGALRLWLALDRAPAGYQLALRVECQSEQEARALANQLTSTTDTLRKWIARDQQTPNPNDLSGVLTAGSFRHEGPTVLGGWPIAPGFLDNLTKGAL